MGTKAVETEPYDIRLRVGQKVYVVMVDKFHGGNKNLVFAAKVDEIVINKPLKEKLTIKYYLYLEKCVVGGVQDMNTVNRYCYVHNERIDNGNRGYGLEYPVFTTKERCIAWLRSEKGKC